jgi:hypothetical protein
MFFFFFNNIFLFTVDSCSRSFLSSYVKILPTTLLNLLIKWVINKKKKKKKLTKESLHLHIHLLHALCYISTEDDGTH